MSIHDEHDHDDHGGLHRDLRSTGAAMDRRGLLKAAARVGVTFSALQLFGCSSSDAATLTGTDPSSTTPSGSCVAKVPEETAGPFPGDSSNGPDVLNQTGVVRSDIRSSFAGLSGTAAGVPLTIELTIVSASSCTPLAGYAVYLWHCYSGRWPHIHFEVYRSLTTATAVSNKIATSQIALPKSACDTVYAASGYSASVTNLSRISLASDMVFSDGASLELATMSGDVTSALTAALTVAV
jgi:protocatechuate 3,4-dioxygenase beta subunit